MEKKVKELPKDVQDRGLDKDELWRTLSLYTAEDLTDFAKKEVNRQWFKDKAIIEQKDKDINDLKESIERWQKAGQEDFKIFKRLKESGNLLYSQLISEKQKTNNTSVSPAEDYFLDIKQEICVHQWELAYDDLGDTYEYCKKCKASTA